MQLHVIEYFDKSLKVIQNDTLEYGMYKSLLVPYFIITMSVSHTVSHILTLKSGLEVTQVY